MCEARALRTQGSRLRLFAPSENVRKLLFCSLSHCRKANSNFVVQLKKLASTCSFGAFLDEALRDRRVSGFHSKISRTQRHLLAVRELTFTAAHKRCIADELAKKANKGHMEESVTVETNKIQDLNLMDVEVLGMPILNDVKGVVAKRMVLMFANSKLQSVIVVSKKTIVVQYARPDCRKGIFKEGPTILEARA